MFLQLYLVLLNSKFQRGSFSIEWFVVEFVLFHRFWCSGHSLWLPLQPVNRFWCSGHHLRLPLRPGRTGRPWSRGFLTPLLGDKQISKGKVLSWPLMMVPRLKKWIPVRCADVPAKGWGSPICMHWVQCGRVARLVSERRFISRRELSREASNHLNKQI
jgi:hypothetical protein